MATRRSLMTALALAALVLGACSDDSASVGSPSRAPTLAAGQLTDATAAKEVWRLWGAMAAYAPVYQADTSAPAPMDMGISSASDESEPGYFCFEPSTDIRANLRGDHAPEGWTYRFTQASCDPDDGVAEIVIFVPSGPAGEPEVQQGARILAAMRAAGAPDLAAALTAVPD